MAHYGEIFERKKQVLKNRKLVNRILIREEGQVDANAIEGRVVAAEGKFYYVRKNDDNCIYECEPAGALVSPNSNASLVSVGDETLFVNDKKGNLYGTIVKVLQRRSQIARRASGKVPYEHVIASNIEKVVIFMSAAEPFYNKRLIDRLIVAADMGELEPIICINKSDLMPEKELKSDLKIYSDLKIPVIFFSAKTGKNWGKFQKLILGSNSVFIGYSGVGKSTAINKLLCNEIQQTGEISSWSGKGKHTTSAVRMFNLPNGFSVIDTPGIREFAFWGLQRDQLTFFFKEFENYYLNCRFKPCTHTHEPDCAVKEAVEAGILDYERYLSYLSILDGIE